MGLASSTSTSRASRQFLLGLLASTAAISVAASASAQTAPAGQVANGVEEVVVTARRVEENIQNVPVAITALGETALREKAIYNPIELQFNAPSVQLTTGFGRLGGTFTIRGLAQGTTTYYAEVAGGPTIAGAPFYDLSNVQVLNGPQGTLFGRANTAGAVLVEPNRPKMNQLSGSLDVSLGNYDAQRITAVVNVPIITDQLAFRAAYNRTKVDGYTKLIGRSRGALNGVGTENLRLSLLFRRGGFTNYTVAESLGVNQTSGGYSVVGVNPNIAILNLPANIAAPNGLTAGTATFGTVCRSAVTAGLSPDLNTCIDQRLRAAATIKPIALAELARTQATHDGIRSVLPSADLDQYETLDSYTVVNNSQLDLGKIGFTTVTLKNIFGFQAFTGGSAWVVDGVGGIQQESISTSGFTPQAFAVSAQQTGKHAYFDEGPYAKTYSNETQVRGVVGEDLIVWSLGGYYQRAPVPVNPNGIRNLSKSNMGLALATGGYNPSFAFLNGGYTQQKALYASTTVDLSRFASAIAGLHVTGGLRKSWDHQLIKSLAAVTDVPTGRYVPGTATQAETKSNGYNYSIALDAQITDDLLVYGTTRKGYRPGGINNVTNASLFPNYTPTYAPETVKDIEFGAKYDFAIGDARGRINGAAYRTEYSNIQRQFSGAIGGATATYIVNASAALIKGGELQGQLVWGAWDISSNYAFTDAKFTRWIGSDPLALIRPGNTQCLPGSSTSICLIDLSQNPFAGVPRHSGSVTVKYHVPLSDHLGDVSASATLYAQSVKYFADYATRAQTEFGALGKFAVSQPAFERVNLRVDWKDVGGSSISLAAYVNNLFDKNYAISTVTQLHSIGNATKLFAEPRMFGVEFRYRFGE